MANYDLYAVQASSIEEARELLAIRGIALESRESSFHRGPYFAQGEIGSENIELKINLDPYEDCPNEDRFSDHKYLLYINNTEKSEFFQEKLIDDDGIITLLRSEVF